MLFKKGFARISRGLFNMVLIARFWSLKTNLSYHFLKGNGIILKRMYDIVIRCQVRMSLLFSTDFSKQKSKNSPFYTRRLCWYQTSNGRQKILTPRNLNSAQGATTASSTMKVEFSFVMMMAEKRIIYSKFNYMCLFSIKDQSVLHEPLK